MPAFLRMLYKHLRCCSFFCRKVAAVLSPSLSDFEQISRNQNLINCRLISFLQIISARLRISGMTSAACG